MGPRREPVETEMTIPSMQYETRDGACEAGCGATVTELRFNARSGWARVTCDTCCTIQLEAAARETTERLCQERLHQLSVPPLYESESIGTFQHHGQRLDTDAQARVLQLARRYMAQWPEVPRIVVLQGPPGTGKGHVLWSLAKAAAGQHGAKARVVKLSDAIRDLRAAWSGGDSEAARLATYRIPAFLGIDEVSRHAFYGQPQQHLYDLLDYREEHLKATVITTNENAESLAALLGPALMSRCLGSGSIWNFGTADYRIHRGKLIRQEQAT